MGRSSAKKKKAIEDSGLLETHRLTKEQWKKERHCWWTRPFRHHYKNGYCVYCDKERFQGF